MATKTVKEVIVNGTTWNKESIKNLLQNNDKAVKKALLVIYGYQTAEEQSRGETVEDNGMGFNGLDAEILTSFAQQLQRKGYLSPKQMEITRKKMTKYANQILKHMARNNAEQEQEQAETKAEIEQSAEDYWKEQEKAEAEFYLSLPEDKLLQFGQFSILHRVGETVYRKEVTDILFRKSELTGTEPEFICSNKPDYRHEKYTKEQVLTMRIMEYHLKFWNCDTDNGTKTIACFGVLPD